MVYYIIKLVLSALIIVIISEVSKKSTLLGSLLASLPFTSLLAIIWMHFDHVQVQKIAQLSQSIFYLVLPSLIFFLLFPFLLHRGMQFWTSLLISAGTTSVAYLLLIWVLGLLQVKI